MSEPMAAAPLSLKELVRPLRHLAAWADYHMGGGPRPSRRAARLTYYASPDTPGTREPAS
jgi:hypothetical protein